MTENDRFNEEQRTDRDLYGDDLSDKVSVAPNDDNFCYYPTEEPIVFETGSPEPSAAQYADEGEREETPPSADNGQTDKGETPEDRKAEFLLFIKEHKALCITLAVLTVLVGALSVFLLTNDVIIDRGDEPQITEPAGPVMPETTEDICAFYAGAVASIRNGGSAGYNRKLWQNVNTLNITGIEFIDELISGAVTKHFVDETEAETDTLTIGTEDAKQYFPPFALWDLSCVTYADCYEENGFYYITMTFADADTPRSDDSYLAGISDEIFFTDTVIEPMLDDIPQLTSYTDLRVFYSDYTIEAVLTPEGKFGSLIHTANVKVTVDTAKIAFVPLSDISLDFDTFEEYSGFVYLK